MAKFRKKPVVIEAIQFDGSLKGVKLVEGFMNCFCGYQQQGDVCNLWIETLEGGHYASPGDWIIRGIKGEYYPCKPDIFEATYEEAGNGE